MKRPLHGWLMEFESPQALLAAARRVHEEGLDAEGYVPFHVEGLAETLGDRADPVAPATFVAGIVGGVCGFAMQWWSATLDRPIHVGGRPLNSWPMFVPVTFELTILFAALAAVLVFLVTAGLPRLRHPVFDAPDFDLATRHRFFLLVHPHAKRSEEDLSAWLTGLRPVLVAEVDA